MSLSPVQYTPGSSVDAYFFADDGRIGRSDTLVLETIQIGHWTNYGFPMVEVAGGFFEMPSSNSFPALPAGVYNRFIRERPSTTLTGSVITGAIDLPVANEGVFQVGDSVKVGNDTVTISAITVGHLTVSALPNGHSSGASVVKATPAPSDPSVGADGPWSWSGTILAPSSVVPPGTQLLFGYSFDNGVAVQGRVVRIELLGGPQSTNSVILETKEDTVSSDVNGLWQFSLISGKRYRVVIPDERIDFWFTMPGATTDARTLIP